MSVCEALPPPSRGRLDASLSDAPIETDALAAAAGRAAQDKQKTVLYPDAALLVPPRCTLHRRLPFRLPFSWGPGSSPAAIKVVMSTNGESPAPDAASDSRDPSGFLSEIIGAPVTVKLNSGIVYKGREGRCRQMRPFSDIVR
jgi:hypothetical protein